MNLYQFVMIRDIIIIVVIVVVFVAAAGGGGGGGTCSATFDGHVLIFRLWLWSIVVVVIVVVVAIRYSSRVLFLTFCLSRN